MHPDYKDFTPTEMDGVIRGAIDAFEDHDVSLHGYYVNKIEHQALFLVEADDIANVDAAFYPLLKFCEAGGVVPYQKVN